MVVLPNNICPPFALQQSRLTRSVSTLTVSISSHNQIARAVKLPAPQKRPRPVCRFPIVQCSRGRPSGIIRSLVVRPTLLASRRATLQSTLLLATHAPVGLLAQPNVPRNRNLCSTCHGVQCFRCIVSDRVIGNHFRVNLCTKLREAVGETTRRASRNHPGNRRVLGGRTKKRRSISARQNMHKLVGQN